MKEKTAGGTVVVADPIEGQATTLPIGSPLGMEVPIDAPLAHGGSYVVDPDKRTRVLVECTQSCPGCAGNSR